MASFWAGIWTWYLHNMKQDCQPLGHCIHWEGCGRKVRGLFEVAQLKGGTELTNTAGPSVRVQRGYEWRIKQLYSIQ